jgi:hypothetical protein
MVRERRLITGQVGYAGSNALLYVTGGGAVVAPHTLRSHQPGADIGLIRMNYRCGGPIIAQC